MPTETRKIQFSADEIRAALIHYALRTEMRLPKEGIDKVRFAPDGANVTFIYGRNPDGEKREVISPSSRSVPRSFYIATRAAFPCRARRRRS